MLVSEQHVNQIAHTKLLLREKQKRNMLPIKVIKVDLEKLFKINIIKCEY